MDWVDCGVNGMDGVDGGVDGVDGGVDEGESGKNMVGGMLLGGGDERLNRVGKK